MGMLEQTGEIRVRSAKEWLRQAQEAVRNGFEVTCYDDPLRRTLGFTWGYDIDERRVILGLSDLKNTMGDLDGFGLDPEVLKKHFLTPEGRMQIPALLKG